MRKVLWIYPGATSGVSQPQFFFFVFVFVFLSIFILKYNPENKNLIAAWVSFLCSWGRQEQGLIVSLELDTVGELLVPRRMSGLPSNTQVSGEKQRMSSTSLLTIFLSTDGFVSYSVKSPPSAKSPGFCTHHLSQWKLSP